MTTSATVVVEPAASKSSAPYASSTSSRMTDSRYSRVENNRKIYADSTNEMVEAGEVPCVAHTIKQPPIASPTAALGCVNGLTATLTLLLPGVRVSR